jgi:hypothetical protein
MWRVGVGIWHVSIYSSGGEPIRSSVKGRRLNVRNREQCIGAASGRSFYDQSSVACREPERRVRTWRKSMAGGEQSDGSSASRSAILRKLHLAQVCFQSNMT